MSLDESRRRADRRRPRRRSVWRSPVGRVALGVVAAAVLLLLGVSIGRALEDGPEPGGTQTSVRTLAPEQLPPAARTITVTVTE